jgi:hypothetical protein
MERKHLHAITISWLSQSLSCSVPGFVTCWPLQSMLGPEFIAKLKLLAIISSSLIKSPKFSLLAIQGVLSTVLLTYHAASHYDGRSFVMVPIFVSDKIHAKPALALIMPLQEAICISPCTRFAAFFSVEYSPWPHCPVNSCPTESNPY